MAEMGVPGRLAFSPTRKKTSARMEYQDEQQNSFVRRDSIVTAASITGDDSGQQGTYCEWINVQFRIRIVTLLRWRSLAQNLGFKGDDQMASYLLNMYYEQNVGSTSRQRKRETPQRSGKVKETVATSLHQANVDRRDVIESEALSIQSQKGERMHVEYLDSMQEGEGPAPRDGWTDDGGDSHGDAVSSKEMVARWTDDGGTHGDAVGSKEMEARWAGDGGDTHGDAVSSKEMEARCTDDGDDTHGDAVSSKEMEARWTDDGDDTHGDAVSSKEMEARWTDDCDDSHGDAVGSKEMEARWTDDCDDSHGDAVGSKEMEARWTDDGDDTHGDAVGSKEMEARWTDDGDDTHGDAVSSKEMEARWTDDTHGDAVSSKEMEARWTDDGDDTHGDAVSSKEMEAQWTDDGDDTHGDAVGSKEMAAYPSDGGELHCFIKQEPEETNSDNDITNKDDTNGLHSNEKEVRSSEDGALKCVIKEEPVDIGEEEPVDFIKKEPVDDDEEGSYLHEVPSCSTQDENSSQLSFLQRSGDTSYDRSHDEEHLLEDSSDTIIGSQSSLSAHDGRSRGSGFLLNQVDCYQGSSSSEVVSEANSFLCSVCKMVFENRHDLCKHLKLKHGVEKPYDCTLCRRSYKFRCELKRHLKGHTGEKACSSDVVPEANSFRCIVCKKVFNEKDGLCKHLKFIRRVEKPHECTICSRNFKFRCELKRHLRDHKGEMRHAFSSGDKRIWDMYKLNDLMAVRTTGKKHSTREKQFQCSFCSKTFTGNSSLNRHVKSHMEGKPFQCMDCSMRFPDASALAKHATMHSGEKPFECSICSKRYANKYHFADHVKLHTGERPYACPMCERRFIRKADMKRHVTIHTGERPYACSMCPKRFRNRNTFVLHYEKTHRY
ncbi:zinc finger protein 648-like isoform X2 [Lytechinus pictus]|uniref:zinc finger protein 648-like isoform X2 n=1 Tax=Lytechinus pictus TaxID=7653 RepID=UPI0030BA13CD